MRMIGRRSGRSALLAAAHVATGLSIMVVLWPAPSIARASAGPEWLPFVGTHGNALSCTWNNGCNDPSAGYHGYYAIDFALPGGARLYAAGDGVVHAVQRGCGPSYPCGLENLGNSVRIRHDDGRYSVYGHMSAIPSDIRAGARVATGRLIGYSGNSSSGAYHLHYEERSAPGWNSKVDPGPMKAQHGSTVVQYPAKLGYTTWFGSGAPNCGVQSGEPGCHGNHTLRSDGFSGSAGLPRDGSFVSDASTGRVYRIAGGAPIYVSSWSVFGGSQPTTRISHAQLGRYRPFPRDGTFVTSVQDGRVYRIAGGAPVYVSTWSAFGGPKPTIGIDKWAIDRPDNPHAHLRSVPADGTFVTSMQDGRVYRIAGGAPIYVGTWSAFGGPQPSVGIDKWAIDHITDPHAHLRRVPADGTFVRVANGAKRGLIARAAGGRLLGLTSCAPLNGCPGVVGVEEGGFDAYQRRHPHPADGTLLRGLPSQQLWRIDGGLRHAVTTGSGAVSVNDATVAAIPLATAAGSEDGTPVPAVPAPSGNAAVPPPATAGSPAGAERPSPCRIARRKRNRAVARRRSARDAYRQADGARARRAARALLRKRTRKLRAARRHLKRVCRCPEARKQRARSAERRRTARADYAGARGRRDRRAARAVLRKRTKQLRRARREVKRLCRRR